MNIWRFFKKCATDPPAAMVSAKLVARSYYGRWHWLRHPDAPLAHRLPTGGILLLEPKHSFTHGFWPAVDTYEPDVQAALKYLLRPGGIFIDCGANIGYFSVLAGDLVGSKGKVISIEANPITFELLECNLNVNCLRHGINCALTFEPGEVELFLPNKGDLFSSLRKNEYVKGDLVRSFKVLGRTLDDVVKELAPPRVDVVKIDIEGGELDVLHSAPHLLQTFRPVLIVEYGTTTWPSFGATPEGLKELMHMHHYTLQMFDLKHQKLMPITEEVWQSRYANLVLVPEERFEKLV